MDNREVCISTMGECISVYEGAIDYIIDGGYDELVDGNYAGCIIQMVSTALDYSQNYTENYYGDYYVDDYYGDYQIDYGGYNDEYYYQDSSDSLDLSNVFTCIMIAAVIGVISVLSNVMPRETHDICRLFFEGKVQESAKLQLDSMELINALFCETNPIPVKTALGLMGYNVGHLRMPLCDMEPANLERLKIALKNAGLIK